MANYLEYLEGELAAVKKECGLSVELLKSPNAQQLKSGGVIHVAKDALFSFCMTASLKGDKDAIDAVETRLKAALGDDFPGAYFYGEPPG